MSKKFKIKREALEYCFEHLLKPSNVGLEKYNQLRQIRQRYEKDNKSITDNAINKIFDACNVKSDCTYIIYQ